MKWKEHQELIESRPRLTLYPHKFLQILKIYIYISACMYTGDTGHNVRIFTQISNSSELHADWQVQFASETFLLAMKC